MSQKLLAMFLSASSTWVIPRPKNSDVLPKIVKIKLNGENAILDLCNYISLINNREIMSQKLMVILVLVFCTDLNSGTTCQNASLSRPCITTFETLCFDQDIAIINDNDKNDINFKADGNVNITVPKNGLYVLRQDTK